LSSTTTFLNSNQQQKEIWRTYRHRKTSIIHECWEPWATIWQGHCSLAGSWQGQGLQVHHVSHWGFEETWSGSLCLEERNINLKVFVYERSETGYKNFATRPEFYVCETKQARWKQGGLGVLTESRRVLVSLCNLGDWSKSIVFQVEDIVSQEKKFFLHCITSYFVWLKKPDANIKIFQLGHQPSGLASRHSLPEWVSPFMCLVSSVLP
jgi:hypothetical protein